MKKQDFNIDAIVKTDEPAAASFINGILESEYPDIVHHLAADDLNNLCDAYSGPRDTFFTVKQNNNIIGTIGIKEDSKEVALLRRFFIAPDYRNKGLGTILINKVIDFCIANNYQMISFRGNNQMDTAVKVIEKMGFIRKDIVSFGEFHIYIYVKLL
ncbi:MAG: GNAT family N-acetyltransferase [Candidatus Auribacterota bacterium]|jgi:GNAT superfamily N-acetyltransferase|uniref:GNAT family N-acetyltransferase n=1 Tax=Candidatus Auribacter fodinae TaxID=2093366 RepID=A0A3A4QVD7_9BACT|nr:MAG: GNAT family N-acetyltransferase [Candidatus Auribacter fodinae]